jgi:hypothetical protein
MSKEVYQDLTYFEYLVTDWWRSRRAKAIRDAYYRCQVEGCEAMDLHLHCHHLSYERLGNEKDEDLLVLCGLHHKQYHLKH